MPNTFAYIALFSWPFISLIFYKKMPVVNATFWTIVGGFLFLPVNVGIDFPLFPELDKESISSIMALVGCIFIKKIKINFIPKSGLERWLVLTVLFSPALTVFNNQEMYNYIPGLTSHDLFSNIVNQYLNILPFIIGMQIIKTYEDQLMLFKLIVVACLFYSIFILYEIRMSPQLHSSIYGFFPHSFGQQMRFGGFRAVVFLGHGLIVAMFIAVSIAAATILMKLKIKTFKFTPKLIIFYLFILLVLSKTVGAFILGLVLLLAIATMTIYGIKRLTMFFLIIFLTYPLLLIFELFPHDTLVQLANDFNPDRGQSLAFRFHHESLLLAHAQEKLFFGWGSWGRNRIDGSVTDGYWIIMLGIYGLVGFVAYFGLFALSALKATKTVLIMKTDKHKILMISHALIVSVILIDQIPNASLSGWLIFVIGALLGRVKNTKLNDEKHYRSIDMQNIKSRSIG